MEKYKENIEKMLETNNDIQSVEDNIRKFLKSDFENHKITEDEYIELMKFLNTKVKEKDDEEKKKKQLGFDAELKKFQQKIHLDVEPIYKCEMGVIAPKRKIQEGMKSDQEEER